MTEITLTDIEDVIANSLGANIAEPQFALLGNFATKEIEVDGSDQSGLVYVHGLGDDKSSSFVAFKSIEFRNFFGRPVEVVKTKQGYKIVGLAPEDATFIDGVETSSQLPVLREQIMFGGIVPTEPASGKVLVTKATYRITNQHYVTTDTESGNLIDGSTNDTGGSAINLPTTSGQAKIVMVQIDPTDGTITYKQSSEFNATLTLSQVTLPTIDNGNFLCGWVKLSKGITALTFDNIINTPDLLTTYEGVNTTEIHLDQSGGTSDTYGVLSGAINGVNTTFTVSQSIYNSGSLYVYLNGQLQTQGSSEDWTETTPSAGTFSFITAPTSGDEITAIYQTGSTYSTTYTNIVLTKTANYTITGSEATNTIFIKADCTSADVTITLPTASSYQNRQIIVKRIDASGNSVTVDGNGSETIDGSLTKLIQNQYSAIQLWSDGTEWSIT